MYRARPDTFVNLQEVSTVIICRGPDDGLPYHGSFTERSGTYPESLEPGPAPKADAKGAICAC